MLLLSHLVDQYLVLVCGSDGNCLLSLGNGLLGCSWRLGKRSMFGLSSVWGGGLLNIQFHKPEDLSNIVNKPAISSAVMGEIEPIHSWSVTYSTDMAICLVFCFFPTPVSLGATPDIGHRHIHSINCLIAGVF